METASLSKLFKLPITTLLLILLLAFPTSAFSEVKRGDGPSGMHSVWIYKTVCFDPMPDTAALEKLSTTYGFRPITGDALKAYAPGATAKYLKAWEVDDHGRTFKVSASVADVDAQMAEQFPKFAKGSATGCTVILPATDKPADVGAAMKVLTERNADTTYEAGPFNVTLWVGQTEQNVFLIYHYAPKSGQPGGLLSIVTLAN